MTKLDLVWLSILMVATHWLAFSFGYSKAIKELKGRVDTLAKLVGAPTGDGERR